MSTMQQLRNKKRGTGAIIALCMSLFAAPTLAGGLMFYEVGTADVGLASAGYGARAEDASTVLTNPAGMTRLPGKQFVAGAQLLWSNTKFSIDSGTSPELGGINGGYAAGSGGWFPGGSAFFTYNVSPQVTLGLGLAGNFGSALKYDDDWVGRYYVQQATILGMSILPSIAYKVNDKLSLGASVNAMYGIYKQQVAINIPDALRPGVIIPVQRASGDAQLKLKDETWGWGANLGLLYQADKNTRLGLVWTSQVKLDFSDQAQFTNLGSLGNTLQSRGLLNPTISVGIKVPQTLMGSFFTQLNDRWALLGSVGWQEWSKFGQIQLGLDDAVNSTSLTTSIPFKDTWHAALGAQYRLSQPWLLNFGVAYDSGLQNGSQVSPLLPVNSTWRFAFGARNQHSKDLEWGLAAELMYGGSLDTNKQTQVPVALGGRGNLVGSYDNIWNVVVSAYGNWKF